jgi:hypothetical protein
VAGIAARSTRGACCGSSCAFEKAQHVVGGGLENPAAAKERRGDARSLGAVRTVAEREALELGRIQVPDGVWHAQRPRDVAPDELVPRRVPNSAEHVPKKPEAEVE